MKHPSFLHLLFLLTVAVFTVSVTAQNDGSKQPPAEEPIDEDRPEQRFVWAAACGGMKEIRLSEFALNKSQDEDVREFARLMIADHASANTELQGIAERQQLAWPPASYLLGTNLVVVTETTPRKPYPRRPLYPEIQAKALATIQKLQYAPPADFDRLYITVMKEDHGFAVELFEKAARDLHPSEVRDFAAQTLPKLRAHQEHIHTLAIKSGQRDSSAQK